LLTIGFSIREPARDHLSEHSPATPSNRSRTDCFMPLSPAFKFGNSHQETSTNAYDAQIGQDVPFEMVAADSERKRRLIDRQCDAVYWARLKERVGRFLARDVHRGDSSTKTKQRPPGPLWSLRSPLCP
jgi:hypothetical protein